MKLNEAALQALVKKHVTALIVQENQRNIDTIKIVCKTLPYITIDIVETMRDFLSIDEQIKKRRYNLIFLGGHFRDWVHPKYGDYGPNMIKPIKEMSPKTQVIVVTAGLDTYNIALHEGADGALYLNELVDFMKLLKRLVRE